MIADNDRDLRLWTKGRPQPTTSAHGCPELSISAHLAELAPQSEDFDIPKHRRNAFHGTMLDLTLRARSVDTVRIIGGSTHGGVASAVYAGRDMDYQMVWSGAQRLAGGADAAHGCSPGGRRSGGGRPPSRIAYGMSPNAMWSGSPAFEGPGRRRFG